MWLTAGPHPSVGDAGQPLPARVPWPRPARQPALAAAARSLPAVAGRRHCWAVPRPGRAGGAGAPGGAARARAGVASDGTVASMVAAAAFCRRRREKGRGKGSGSGKGSRGSSSWGSIGRRKSGRGRSTCSAEALVR